ncbi:MAG TPA: MATE family efflux transporter [Candidatus Copromonas faecavium]|uniref:Multidrug export protein MepA n=1 Tax=Candidatus Copromonas faecavium (nom. illeg.) TaxID=2840740 RepID=A0A9D1D611_9FIRM|nr:MATE family efflux transporter [Candidatus Copromonas faecavium]
MENEEEQYLFEKMPVPRAVATLAVPTIISQVVTMIYNLADTFFVGQLGDPLMVAAVSLVSPWFNLLTALGNLFGLGGSSLISRMMGLKKHEDIKYVSAFSIWGGAAVTLLFSILTYLFRGPLLNFLGASPDTYSYAEDYLRWVVVFGGVPTMASLALGHLLRSEGHAKQASAGMMFGGILNVILDPVFIFGFHLNVAGAAMATALSNTASVVFFVVQYIRLRGNTSVSLNPRFFTFRFLRQVFSVGLASALATALGNASNMVMVHLASGYGDIPVAAYGVVKRIDQFPLNVSMGLCQGFMPLVGYNFASKDYGRMRKVSTFSWKVALIISACFIACFAAFAPQLLHLFIPEEQTSALGASFLRIACLAVPLTSVNFLISYTLQAMGKGVQSAALTFSRQGLLNIPLLIVMNLVFGLYGMIWTQLVVEIIMFPVSLMMYFHTFHKLRAEG